MPPWLQHTCPPLHVTPHAPQSLLDVRSVHRPVLHWPKLALHWVQEVVEPPVTWHSAQSAGQARHSPVADSLKPCVCACACACVEVKDGQIDRRVRRRQDPCDEGRVRKSTCCIAGDKCAADPSHSFRVPSILTAAHRLQVVTLSQIWQLATHAVQTLDAGSGK